MEISRNPIEVEFEINEENLTIEKLKEYFIK